jgi:hypothetical protein
MLAVNGGTFERSIQSGGVSNDGNTPEFDLL